MTLYKQLDVQKKKQSLYKAWKILFDDDIYLYENISYEEQQSYYDLQKLIISNKKKKLFFQVSSKILKNGLIFPFFLF